MMFYLLYLILQKVTTKRLYGFDKDIYYQGNVDTIVPTTSIGYKVFWKDIYGKNVDGYTELIQLDPVSIKYKKPKHMVFNLKKEIQIIIYYLL